MAIAAKIDNSSLLYIVICSLGVLAFCLVGIYPNVQAMRQLDNDVTKFNAEVQQQEFLYPVYRRLVKEVQQQPPALAMPDKTKLPREEIPQLGQLFMKLAEKNHLHFDSAAPDAASYLEESGQLTMNVISHGDFFNFRGFMLDICQLPYLNTIDEVTISPLNEEKQLKLKLQLYQE